MTDRVSGPLRRRFEEHRIVFWYDRDQNLRDEFEQVDLPDVTKVEIANNEFGLKYRMLRQEPENRFLVYKEGARPDDTDNWLLDIELATTVFHADQPTIWLNDLGLPPQFDTVVRDHMEFYRASGRMSALKSAVTPTDTPTQIRLKMLAICVGASGGLDTVIEALLAELADESSDSFKLIARTNLSEFLWKQVTNKYGYRAASPDFEDFAITLFKSAYAMALNEDADLSSDALVLFRRWKNDRIGAKSFETLSEKYRDLLNIPTDVARREPSDLGSVDFFEEIDRHIIRRVVHDVASRTVSSGETLKILRDRRQSHWFDRYAEIYQAIEHAVRFQQVMTEANLGMTSLQEGVQRYTSTWYQIDQLYRKFIYFMQKSTQATTLLGELFDAIERQYTTNFLLPLNNAWQDQIAKQGTWGVPDVPRQLDFYKNTVSQYRRKDQKVVVIISDALRYEVADECLNRILGLNRFDAELTPMIGTLPSYTQLGMASLLPNQTLQLDPSDGSRAVDGSIVIQGSAGREKQLATGRPGDRVKTIRAEDVINMRVDEGKAMFREHDVIYVYHNRIDAMGDKRDTEDRLPEAAESAIDDLVVLVRKLTSANVTNIVITADHGFLYQHKPLEESDFSVADPKGDDILVRNRRFVVGKSLADTPGMKKFTEAQLGLSGDLDVLISNSINRLRVKGAGSRFVHGGASLQEIVVPLLRVGKRREADVRAVEVQIISTGKNLITSGQIAVNFYQSEPVSAKVKARTLTAGLYASDGTLISDEHTIIFDLSSDSAREREVPRKFLLSKDADKFNNQDVYLKLRERVGETTHFQEYASQRYQLRRGISTDFDF